MRPAVWVIAAALPLAAPPKLLINAQLDARSAAGGLEGAFRPLVAAQPQPTWIGYSVPSSAGYRLGCEYVSPGGSTVPGVIHLEPPDHAVILFRVDSGAVTRVRVLSPDCEIDAGGVPMHWLDDVRPAESTVLLQSFTRAPATAAAGEKDRSEPVREGAVSALAASADPGALDVLTALARRDQNPRIRRQCVAALARSRDPRALAFFDDVLKH